MRNSSWVVKRWAAAGCSAAALALWATPALAQTGAAASPSLPAPLPSGTTEVDTNVVVDPYRVYGDDSAFFSPFSLLAGFGLDISAALATRYDDNVARRAPGTGLRPGLSSRGDWSFQPSLNLSARRPLGRQAVFLNASVGKTYYARNTLLNRENLGFGGGLQWQLGGRCGGTVQGGWTHRGTQFMSFIDVVPSKTETTRFAVNASCMGPGRFTVHGGYDHANVRNRTDSEFVTVVDRSFSDVRSDSFNGGVGYQLSGRGEVGVQGQWRRSVFPHQLLPDGSTNSNTVTGVNGYVNYRIGRSLSANGSLGRSWVKRGHGGGQAFAGSVWDVGLNYSGPRFGANIATGRSVNGSSGGFSNYSISKYVTGNVSYRLNSRAMLSAGVSHRDYDFGDPVLAPGFLAVDSRRIDRYFVGANYRMNRILSFSLDYNHQRAHTNPTNFDYRNNAVIFVVRANL